MHTSDSQMLLAFLDGELDGVHEEALFRKLSAQAELRAEMQDHLAIRKAVQHDAVAFAPPASATAAVFAGLGFTIPPVAHTLSAGSASGAVGTGIRGGIRTAGLIGGSSALTLLLTLGYMMLTSPSREMVPTSPSMPAARPVPAAMEPTPPHVSTPSSSAQAHIPEPAAEPSVELDRSESRQASAEQDLADVRGMDPADISAFDRRPLPRPQYQTQVRHLSPEGLEYPTGLTLLVRNASARSYPASNLSSQYDPAITNMCIGVLYRFSDHQAVGMEVGHEAFAQRFGGEDGAYLVEYEQNPLAFWATASYRLTADPFLSPVLVPFVQFDLGGAVQLGPLGRAYAGFEIRPVQNVSFLLGVEGSVLYYRFQDQWFKTNKWGLTYGLTYGF